ncbi:MAG: tyrosine-type recombinase/integrase [Anaerolineae bacterium]
MNPLNAADVERRSPGVLADNVKSARRPRLDYRRKHAALSAAELEAILVQPDTTTRKGIRDRALLMLMAYTGMQPGEVQRVVLADVHTDGQATLVIAGRADTRPGRAVSLERPELHHALIMWLRVHPSQILEAPLFCGVGNRNLGARLSLAAIQRLVRAYYKQAGIAGPHKAAHSLRSAAQVNTETAGAPDA